MSIVVTEGAKFPTVCFELVQTIYISIYKTDLRIRWDGVKEM